MNKKKEFEKYVKDQIKKVKESAIKHKKEFLKKQEEQKNENQRNENIE